MRLQIDRLILLKLTLIPTPCNNRQSNDKTSSRKAEISLVGAKMSVAEATNLQGAKIAVICNDTVVTYLRDNFDHIPNPNQWDLPGGVREAGETALDCALRETQEEFGVCLSKSSVVYEATFIAQAAANLPKREVAFFVCMVSPDVVSIIEFGEEGQCWEMMPIRKFLTRDDAVPELQAAFKTFWTR
ncbi:NUDIX domain-containing protein [Ruegeria sp. HKCCC1038]|uniref:NUDIX domain-containing protein n=1 Tax=Ruegeria sp. HKCCC1038 TaxID=2682982 RepID=UPI0014890DD4|nr:NUDIX hydrolase [Ruegeria sp. HKCCC1038]